MAARAVDKVSRQKEEREEEEEEWVLEELEEEDENARANFASTGREERARRYEEAVRQLNMMLEKAEAFNRTCEALAEESPVILEKPPSEFTGGELRDYQLEGVRWLTKKHWLGESGIIGDEMGLGKTVQIIAYCAWMRARPVEDGPVLIVVPLSTLRNWVLEFARFTPGIPVVEYHGTPEERAALRREHLPHLPSWAGEPARRGVSGTSWTSRWTRAERAACPVFVTTYAIAMNDRAVLGQNVVPWGLLVVDESHRLKKATSRLKAELDAYCRPPPTDVSAETGTQRIILTGTPLQNDLLELWSLCNFVMPLIFADREAFRSVYGFLALDSEEGKNDVVSKHERDNIIDTLHRLLDRYLLRRTKAEVNLKLPPKVECVVYCPQTRVQRRLLVAAQAQRLEECLEDMRWARAGTIIANDEGRLTVVQTSNARASAPSLRNVAMQLRKIANHPYLIGEPVPSDALVIEDERDDSFLRRTRNSLQSSSQSTPSKTSSSSLLTSPATPAPTLADEGLIQASGKLAVLDHMLRRLHRDGHKVLIFSQFVRVLHILEDYLRLRSDEFGDFCFLDGSTDRETRQTEMDRFNSDKSVFCFLLSTRAGGLGVNLTGADTVIVFDSDFNPHGDSQAEDRAHRIGQTKAVVVYRLLTAGSIEETLVHRANSKRALERIVLRDGSWIAERSDKDAKPWEISDDLLRQWLRDDVTGAGAHNPEGIPPSELETILDRDTAVACGSALLSSSEGQAAARRLGFEELAGKASHDESAPVAGTGYEFVFHSAAQLYSLAEFAAGDKRPRTTESTQPSRRRRRRT